MCNCTRSTKIDGYTRSQTGHLIANDVMTSAAMCAGCHLSTATRCLVDGKLVIDHARTSDCPRGRHPKGGIVRWFIDWYGVPYPIRLYLKLRGKIVDYKALPGCGCVVFLKDLLTGLRSLGRTHVNQ